MKDPTPKDVLRGLGLKKCADANGVACLKIRDGLYKIWRDQTILEYNAVLMVAIMDGQARYHQNPPDAVSWLITYSQLKRDTANV